ncbi:unnamed protein product [Protopolystoma xenopodis]|uniref:Uncharacterized protein n=1 Tax=Protopolystoma xenopodis TaxID=117903 RepID=A0A3S5BX75_9PLAT|nr:unnamed protein product [Protopolystoma xenopodis]
MATRTESGFRQPVALAGLCRRAPEPAPLFVLLLVPACLHAALISRPPARQIGSWLAQSG